MRSSWWDNFVVELPDTGPKTGGEFIQALEYRRVKLPDDTKQLLLSPSFIVPGPAKVRLTMRAWFELGALDDLPSFSSSNYDKAFGLVRQQGFDWCPAWVGPALCWLRPRAIFAKSELFIAMEPIADASGRRCFFHILSPYDEWRLEAIDIGSNYRMTLVSLLVVAAPNKAAVSGNS